MVERSRPPALPEEASPPRSSYPGSSLGLFCACGFGGLGDERCGDLEFQDTDSDLLLNWGSKASEAHLTRLD